jgi:phage terminase large subunit-like protein
MDNEQTELFPPSSVGLPESACPNSDVVPVVDGGDASATGRKKTMGESRLIKGSRWILLPLPHRDKSDVLIGYKYIRTDLVKLLKSLPLYNPFLEAGKEYYFDSKFASDVIIPFIIQNCKFPEGKDTGKPFIPERWQWAIYLNAYCWKDRVTGFRRYTEVFIYVPRKNGKTTAFGAVPSVIALFLDEEKRSQNFCCAADIEQATLNFRHASYMVENNPEFMNRLKQGRVRTSVRLMEHVDGATLKVLSSISETKHGLSPCYVGVDEVHAHKDGELIDVMMTGTAGRDQPQTWYTTTADFDRPSVCNELYARAKSVALGTASDPNLFPVIYEADSADPFDSEDTWRKANPNYGISVRAAYFKREVAKAKNSPAILGRFLRLHLNIRTAVETSWIYPTTWSAVNPFFLPENLLPVDVIMDWMHKHRIWFSVAREQDFFTNNFYRVCIEQFRYWYTWLIPTMESLKGSVCWGGYDNTNVKDLAAFTFWFPEERIMLPWAWVPAVSIYERSAADSIPYAIWYAAGIIQNTPLTTINEADILTTLLGESDNWEGGLIWQFPSFKGVAFDRWSANFISSSLSSNGIKTIKYPQGFNGMNEPCKKIVSWLEQKQFFHGANPLMAWQIGNTQIKTHPTGTIRPCKNSSSDKIDSVVSLCMAIGADLVADKNGVISSIPGLEDET